MPLALHKEFSLAGNSDEILQRYKIFLEEQNLRKELDYSRNTEKFHHIKPPEYHGTINTSQEGSTRYFKCFYDSFLHLQEKKTRELLDCVETAEAELRYAIAEMERESFAVICRSMAPFLFDATPSLLCINLLRPIDAESVSRSMICHDFYQMLIEATYKQETICRRHIVFALEPQSRQQLEGAEPSEWIAARRRQLDREEAMRSGKNIQAHAKTLEYLKWYGQQQNQILLLERGELEERMDIERVGRVQLGIIVDLFLEHFREVACKGFRSRQELRKLGAEDVKKLSVEEFAARSGILGHQSEHFKIIKGQEVQHYLKTRRNVLVNERIESPLY